MYLFLLLCRHTISHFDCDRFFRLGREKETEVQRDDVIQERDSCRKEKSNLQEEKVRLKKEISDGLSIAENSKNQVSGLQNEIVSLPFHLDENLCY